MGLTYIKAISDELIANALSKGTSWWILSLCLITSTNKRQSEIQGTNFYHFFYHYEVLGEPEKLMMWHFLSNVLYRQVCPKKSILREKKRFWKRALALGVSDL